VIADGRRDRADCAPARLAYGAGERAVSGFVARCAARGQADADDGVRRARDDGAGETGSRWPLSARGINEQDARQSGRQRPD